MLKTAKILALALLMLIGAALILGCSSSPSNPGGAQTTIRPGSKMPSSGLVQSSSEGSVDIDAKWLGERSNSLAFQIDMNTHSVELDQYDLSKLSILRDDAGKDYRPITWDSAPGGHHRGGTLVFPLPDSLRQQNAKYIELVIRDVAGVKERILRWRF